MKVYGTKNKKDASRCEVLEFLFYKSTPEDENKEY